MKKQLIQLSWNGENGEVKILDQWRDCDWLIKADALVDWIDALNVLYEKTLIEHKEKK